MTRHHDGQWLGAALRARDPARACRLVHLCSLKNDSNRDVDSPFDATISKPVKRTLLRQLLIELTGNAAPRAAETDATPELQGNHALLVDDNAVNQKLGGRMLARLGLRVSQAWNGMEALDILRQRRVDVVFMDCQMPVMDGYAATLEIRRPGSGVQDPAVPIIAMTANALSGDRERCLAAGMTDYITKPIDPSRLLVVLQALHLDAQSAANVQIVVYNWASHGGNQSETCGSIAARARRPCGDGRAS